MSIGQKLKRTTITTIAVVAVGASLVASGTSHVDASAPTIAIAQLGDDINGGRANDYFGSSVAMSSNGTRVAIGATGNSEYVRIYDWNGSAWTQVGADITTVPSGVGFGAAIAMSADGSRIAIGAPGDNEGYVRIYDLVSGVWTQVGNFDGTATGENLGTAVALSSNGSRIAIGVNETGATGPARGKVLIYDWDVNTWVPIGGTIVGEADNDSFGDSVALSADGSRIAIGAGNNDESGDAAGHVRVYDLVGGTWTQIGTDIDGEASRDQFGRAVAISADGSRVAIGAYGNDRDINTQNSGHVRIYDLVGGTWTQLGTNINGENAGDGSGDRLALSADGSRVAIGASENDGNGNASGHVRIYDLVGGTWTQIGTDIDGENADDYSGSVAMSSDGSRVAIGASANDKDINTQDSGHVRIYSAPAKPAAPTITSVTGGDGSLTISFTAGSDRGSAISNYKYSTDGVNYTAFSPSVITSPVTITGLSNSTTYAVTLKAVNELGDSLASNSVNGSPVTPTTPATTTTPTTAVNTTTTIATTSTIATTTTISEKTMRLPATGRQSSLTLLLASLVTVGGLVVLSRRKIAE